MVDMTFLTGPLTSGPNAFVYCSAKNAMQFSGPIGSWTTGVLFDNLEVDGNGIQLTNRETQMAGSGWVAAGGCVCGIAWLHKSFAASLQRPLMSPSASGGEVVGDGTTWRSLNEFVSPDSLFRAQLSARLGQSNCQKILSQPDTETVDSAAAELSSVPRLKLSTLAKSPENVTKGDRKLELTNGWLTIGILIGDWLKAIFIVVAR